jgi:hypothetical protein
MPLAHCYSGLTVTFYFRRARAWLVQSGSGDRERWFKIRRVNLGAIFFLSDSLRIVRLHTRVVSWCKVSLGAALRRIS